MKTSKHNIEKFKKWLSQRGAEILPVTNEYEAVRFQAKEIGVLYKSGKVSNQYTGNAVNAFLKNEKWDGRPINVGRKPNYRKQKSKIILRDGTKCFLCGKEMNDDITLDHLIPLTSGGKNTLANMVLMHEACNQAVGHMHLVDKVKLAIEYRK